jgi:hypothetical protein
LRIPFTVDQFFEVFARYNGAIWPGQIVLVVLAIAAVALIFSKGNSTGRTVAGGALVVYALAIYPLLGYLAGHRYPATLTFGAPCPTTIFTLGLMFFLCPPFPRTIAVIPLLWTGVGSIAAFKLRVLQDFGLLAAGVLGIVAGVLPSSPSHSPA